MTNIIICIIIDLYKTIVYLYLYDVLFGTTVDLECEVIGMKKGKIAAVLNRISAINILICTLFLIWYSRVERSFFNSDYLWDLWDLWQLGLYLLDFVLPVLAVSVIFFIKTKRKKLGTVTKKEKIVTFINQFFGLYILVCTVSLVYWNYSRQEVSAAGAAGIGGRVRELVICEILFICSSVYLNKMHKSGKADGATCAAGEKTLLTS